MIKNQTHNYYGKFTNMTKYLISNNIISDDFSLLDIGSSGGINSIWDVFRPKIRALGFDPVISDCEILNKKEINKKIEYMPINISLKPDHPFIIERNKNGGNSNNNSNLFTRFSAYKAVQILKPPSDNLDPSVNNWQNNKLSNINMTIDDIVKEKNIQNVDFIKVDIDGDDICAILSADNTIRNNNILGFMIETNYYGSTNNTDHTFHNTDKMMRDYGFELFDIDVRRYTSSALPGRFQFGCYAQTEFGRIFQGDALYLIDPCKSIYNYDLSINKILKLACLFEIYGKPDHAAELLIKYKDEISKICKVEKLLDILTNEVNNNYNNYNKYIETFNSNPKSFLP
jgi:hypothetical protein